MIFQVKSGIVSRGDIAKLRGDMNREGAALATLITLAPPTGPMISEAKAAGLYHHELMDREYDRIQIVTIQEIIEEGKRLDIPLVKDLLRTTPKSKKTQEELMLPGIDTPADVVPEPTDMLAHLKAKAEPGPVPERKGPKRAPRAKAPKPKPESKD
jgi:hypothetical protein